MRPPLESNARKTDISVALLKSRNGYTSSIAPPGARTGLRNCLDPAVRAVVREHDRFVQHRHQRFPRRTGARRGIGRTVAEQTRPRIGQPRALRDGGDPGWRLCTRDSLVDGTGSGRALTSARTRRVRVNSRADCAGSVVRSDSAFRHNPHGRRVAMAGDGVARESTVAFKTGLDLCGQYSGRATGAVGTGLILLPSRGYSRTIIATSTVDIAAGLCALWLARDMGAPSMAEAAPKRPPTALQLPPRSPAVDPAENRRRSRSSGVTAARPAN